MNKKPHIKAEFKRRLLFLRDAIDLAIEMDDPYFISPSIFKVISYVWNCDKGVFFK